MKWWFSRLHKMKVRVTQEDLDGGVKGDCCPILRGMMRAMGVDNPDDAKFTQGEWAQLKPFRFTLALNPHPKQPDKAAG